MTVRPTPLAGPLDTIAPRYRTILERCEPFLVSHRANWPHLELEPLGLEISPTRRYSPESLQSTAVIDGLHHMDAFTFGDQSMLMPRWVLFDCGEFPGIVFGFGCAARDLPDDVRAAYRVPRPEDDGTFVPLSMWVAIRCAEPKAWFGHNLSSANLVLGDARLPGLGTLTKLLAIDVTRARRQYGATQWTSGSLGLHLKFGELDVLSAWTPAHTHAASLSYRMAVSTTRLAAALGAGWSRPQHTPTRWIERDDEPAQRALQGEIEAGARWRIVDVEPARVGLIETRER